ncbi:hypothetical protein AGMMS49573_07950 [Endomicrobiia bacterium]|nr:hypothetical protein AGMMS49573_07950 [Endomicrobiia bacterium]
MRSLGKFIVLLFCFTLVLVSCGRKDTIVGANPKPLAGSDLTYNKDTLITPSMRAKLEEQRLAKEKEELEKKIQDDVKNQGYNSGIFQDTSASNLETETENSEGHSSYGEDIKSYKSTVILSTIACSAIAAIGFTMYYFGYIDFKDGIKSFAKGVANKFKRQPKPIEKPKAFTLYNFVNTANEGEPVRIEIVEVPPLARLASFGEQPVDEKNTDEINRELIPPENLIKVSDSKKKD